MTAGPVVDRNGLQLSEIAFCSAAAFSDEVAAADEAPAVEGEADEERVSELDEDETDRR